MCIPCLAINCPITLLNSAGVPVLDIKTCSVSCLPLKARSADAPEAEDDPQTPWSKVVTVRECAADAVLHSKLHSSPSEVGPAPGPVRNGPESVGNHSRAFKSFNGTKLIEGEESHRTGPKSLNRRKVIDRQKSHRINHKPSNDMTFRCALLILTSEACPVEVGYSVEVEILLWGTPGASGCSPVCWCLVGGRDLSPTLPGSPAFPRKASC